MQQLILHDVLAENIRAVNDRLTTPNISLGKRAQKVMNKHLIDFGHAMDLVVKVFTFKTSFIVGYTNRFRGNAFVKLLTNYRVFTVCIVIINSLTVHHSLTFDHSQTFEPVLKILVYMI